MKTLHSLELNNLIYDFLLIAVLLLALIIRVPFLFIESITPDEGLYLWYTSQISNNISYLFSGQLIEYHPPLFPLLMLLGKLFFSGEFAYRAVVLIINLFGILFIYFLGVHLKSRFIGIFSALALAFNFTYIYNGTKLMLDAPLTVFVIILIYCLFEVNRKKSPQSDLIAGMCLSLTVLLKWSGLLLLPSIVVYYLSLPSEKSISIKFKRLLTFSFIPSVIIFSFLLYDMFHKGSVMPNLSVLTHPFNTRPMFFYILNLHNILNFLPLVPLCIYGVYHLVATKHEYRTLLLTLLFSLLFLLSIPGVKTYRYSLMILPTLIIISSIGLEGLVTKIFRNRNSQNIAKAICLFSLAALCMLLFPKSKSMLLKNTSRWTGYHEAGQILKNASTSKTTIIVEDSRAIRYTSQIEFKSNDGQLVPFSRYNLNYKKDFETLIEGIDGQVLFEVSLWNEEYPTDFHPFFNIKSEEKYLKKLGFQLVKQVNRPLYIMKKQKYIIAPVIKIFSRP